MRNQRIAAFLLLFLAACSGPDAGGGALVGFIAPAGGAGPAALRGAELEAAEAAHAGELIGRTLVLRAERAGTPAEVEAAARRLLDEGALALIGGFDDASCQALSELAEREEVLFLNVGCRSDGIRSRPGHTTFHVEASDSMYRAALAGAGPGAPAESTSVLWHAGLTRYGAAQLNDRFLRQARVPADAPGWAGWMAVKLLWEALLRTESTDGPTLAAFLSGDSARFDGHKGEPLAFDPATHQLRQPLYRVDPATLATMGERGSAGPAPPPREAVPLTGDRYAFVSNEGSGDVSVIDLGTHRVVSTIPVGARPRGIHVGPDGDVVFVALSDDAPTAESDQDAIAAIAVREGRVTARHRSGTDPEQFALSPDGEELYAANEDAGTASVTDLASGEVLATLVVGIEPEGVAVSPDGRWVYVTAETSNTVSVIDTRSREVVASFLVDVRPRGVTFSPTRPRAYVTSEISGTLSVIDTGRHEVIASIPLDEGAAKPVGVAVSPDGGRVYVANGHGNSISVVDAEAMRVVAEVPVGRRPWGIAVSADGGRIYTANGGSNDVSVVDAATLRVLHTIAVGDRPWGVTLLER
jgi:PQQ-dependent catabolism-associated beta-propeller protein